MPRATLPPFENATSLRCAARSRTSAPARASLRCGCAARPSESFGSNLQATSVRQSEDVVDQTEDGEHDRAGVDLARAAGEKFHDRIEHEAGGQSIRDVVSKNHHGNCYESGQIGRASCRERV